MNFSRNNQKIEVSERIMTCASFVPKDAITCDVGSDHAILSIYLILNNITQKVIVTDINPLPLKHAQTEMQKFNLDENVSFCLCDGIKDLYKYSPCCFVIAGMSGETIIKILTDAGGLITKDNVFVLQPMSRDHYLRKYLYDSGFDILEEKCVYENNKTHIVFKVKFSGLIQKYNDYEYYIGRFTHKFEKIPREKYLSAKINSLKTIIAGKQKGNENPHYEIDVLHQIEERIAYENKGF